MADCLAGRLLPKSGRRALAVAGHPAGIGRPLLDSTSNLDCCRRRTLEPQAATDDGPAAALTAVSGGQARAADFAAAARSGLRGRKD